MTEGSVNRGGEAAPVAMGRLLVLGGGYTGQRFATALAARGLAVTLTHREGVIPPPPDPTLATPPHWIPFDPDCGRLPGPEDLAGTTHLLSTIPPDPAGHDPVLRHLTPVLGQLPLAWVGYLSTTGVYGDQGGGWVDETSPVGPGLGRSRARLACETLWRQQGWPLQVFRLPAIYGPGRTPFTDLLAGRARLIHKPGQVFCRVHVDDIVGGLLHCLALPAEQRPSTLILADETPAPSSETLSYAAHLLGCKLPTMQLWREIEPTMGAMARSFWRENRRVSSALLRQGLGYSLRYPSYREGYQSCLGLA